MINYPNVNPAVAATSMDLIRLILINQMNLRPERVNVYDEKWVIPDIEDMFVTIEYRNGKCLSCNSVFQNQPGWNAPIEVQTVNMLENIVVGLFSRTREAMRRKEQVLMALISSYAQLMQETWAIAIARNANIEDLSYLEGAAMMHRYDVNFSVYAWYQQTVTPGWITPPFIIQVIANDAGSGEIKQNITQFATVPVN